MSEYVPDGEAVGEGVEVTPETDPATQAASNRVTELEQLVGERTADLQRLQAEYVNYKKRVDRDRDLARNAGVERVLVELLPILDAVGMADEHGELTGGFKLVADELDKLAARHGLVAFGAVADEFDPHKHDALMHLPMPGATVTSVSQVMQRGYALGDRVLRPARVAVSDPDPDAQPVPVSPAQAAEANFTAEGAPLPDDPTYDPNTNS